MKKIFKSLAAWFTGISLIVMVNVSTDAAILTNIICEEDGTEVRNIKYTTRADVSKFVVLLALIRGSFAYDFYDRCQGFVTDKDLYMPYEDLWSALWSHYMFRRGQSAQECERAKFISHLILSNCVKDRFLRVYVPTLKSSISGILGTVMRTHKFSIEARKTKGKMWQDWKITAI